MYVRRGAHRRWSRVRCAGRRFENKRGINADQIARAAAERSDEQEIVQADKSRTRIARIIHAQRIPTTATTRYDRSAPAYYCEPISRGSIPSASIRR